MTKTELIKKVADDTGLAVTQVKKTVESLLLIMTQTLSNSDEICIQNFGTLRPWLQNGRMARNPKTGVAVKISPRVSVKFRPGKRLLNELNK